MAQLRNATTVAGSSSDQYKDSFYFVYNRIKYLVVSDLTRGGISLLRSQNGRDTDYRF